MSSHTILDLFTPPAGMVGQVGVLVSMTATDGFLLEALERFTRLSTKQRQREGDVAMLLVLDAGERVRQGGEVPGLYQFHPKPVAAENLLHAKVGLLTFGEGRRGTPRWLRLIVSTGNWTNESACHRLELVWHVDVALERGRVIGAATDAVDVAAAASFVKRLLARYYAEVAAEIIGLLRQSLEAASTGSKRKARRRFMSSLDGPLYAQIRQQLRHQQVTGRNLLVCGAGSFEQGSASPPQVLAELERLPGLTAKAEKRVVVNCDEAGALASWGIDAASAEGWVMHRPSDPSLKRPRRLHAKFIYLGYWRQDCIANGWLYIGSGNLSRPGLLWPVSGDSKRVGNIEAGVFLEDPVSRPADDLAALICWGERIGPDDVLDPGPASEPFDPNATGEPVPPILWVRFYQSTGTLELGWRQDCPVSDYRVEIGSEIHAVSMSTKSVPAIACPGVVRVSDMGGHSWLVPVIDELGRVARLPPEGPQAYPLALAELLDFPLMAEGSLEQDDEDPSDDSDGEGAGPAEQTDEAAGSYALHTAHELVEGLATVQSRLSVEQSQDWLRHLELRLASVFDEVTIAGWRALGVNILAPLTRPGFAPPQIDAATRARYRQMIDATAAKWRLPAGELIDD